MSLFTLVKKYLHTCGKEKGPLCNEGEDEDGDEDELEDEILSLCNAPPVGMTLQNKNFKVPCTEGNRELKLKAWRMELL
jgi:hypothetical protein